MSNEDQLKSPVRPIRSWEEQWLSFRFAVKANHHRNPGGLRNTTNWRRKRMVETFRRRIVSTGEEEKILARTVHEALAYALDAERFLGSLNKRSDRDYFPIEAIDDLAENLIVWLEERGFEIVPREDHPKARATRHD